MFEYKAHHTTYDKRQAVILIHGLVRSTRSMRRLAVFLNRCGYDCYLYSYASTKLTIVEHSHELLDNLLELLSLDQSQTFSLVTHSLGGILARDALSKIGKKYLKQFNKMVMLAPPNKGSKLAKVAVKAFPFLSNWIKPLCELTDHPDAYVHQVLTPSEITIGVIAARLDAKTPPSRTHLKEQSDFLIVTATHKNIMNQPRTHRAIVNFLEKGSFKPIKTEVTMQSLTNRKCTRCEIGSKPLAVNAMKKLLALVPDWRLNSSKKQITRTVKFKNFYETMAFVNAIAWIANTEGHHPDLQVSYNQCIIHYTTHAANGLTDNDFICAAKIDKLCDA